MKKTDPLVSILIVNWNTRESLAGCLDSLAQAAPGTRFQTIVVDNDSEDGSGGMIEHSFPWVTCVSVKRNLGYGAGVNLAVERAGAPLILLLNPDVEAGKGAIRRLIDYLTNHPEIGVAGGMLIGRDGLSQMDDYSVPFPTLLSALLHYSRWSVLISRFDVTPERFTNRSVRQVPGACLLTRREVLERVGPLDEGFFIWFEDVDWCYRAYRSGYGLGICEEALFTHVGGESFEPISVETRRKWYYRSMLRFFRKHRGRHAYATLAAFILTEEALVTMISWVMGLVWRPWRESMLSRSRRAWSFFSFLRREVMG
jgi:GT2 family glycosyltransferase